jgi:hypothetical protein
MPSYPLEVGDDDKILFLEDLILRTLNYGEHVIVSKGEVLSMMGIQFRLSREVTEEDRENRFDNAKIYLIGNWVYSLTIGPYNTAYMCMMLPLEEMPKYLDESVYYEWAVIAKTRLQDLL